MNTNISTNLVVLDLDVILKNYAKKEFWKKKWTIYKHDDLEIEAYISNINVDQGLVRLEVHPKHARYQKYNMLSPIWVSMWTSYEDIEIPFDNPEYNKTIFKNQLLNTCLRIIKNVERDAMETFPEYEKINDLMEKERIFFEGLAKEFLDSHNITDEDIRKSYMSAYLEKCCKDREIMDKFVESKRYKVIGPEYLILISYFNDKEMFEIYKNRIDNLKEKDLEELWEYGRKIDTEEYRQQMMEELTEE